MGVSRAEGTKLRLTIVEAKTLPEAWFLCIKEAMGTGYEYVIDQGSYAGGKRRELDFVTVRVEYPGSRPLVPDVPPGVPPPTDMDYVERYLPYVMAGGLKRPNEQYTYGEDIEPQLDKIIELLKRDGFNSNQTCITVGSKDSVLLEDPQCLKVVDIRVRYGKVHFVVYFRSWDLWGGFPANLAAIQLMKEYTASELDVEDGELIACSKGLHLYDHQWDVANMVLRKG